MSKKLKSHSQENGEIEVIKAYSESEEVEKVIQKIYDIVKKEQDISWNDFAILVRSNSCAKPFTIGLEEAQIPYSFVASKGLYEKNIVVNIISYLKMLDNYHESSAMWQVLNFKFWGIKTSDIINISHIAKKKTVSIYAVVKNYQMYLNLSEETKKALNKISALIEEHTKLVTEQSTWKIIWDFLVKSGYLKYLETLEEAKKQEIFSYLSQFYKKVQLFEKESESPLVKDFLEFYSLEIESGEKGKLANSVDDGPESVKVMTVHGSKGLEFKYVFVVSLVDKRFPSIRRGEVIKIPDELIKENVLEGDVHLQEERRLFYVAMTRAKKGLFLTWALDYGGKQLKKPSIFLKELNLIKLEEDLIKSKEVNFNELSSEINEDVRKISKEDLKKLLPKQFSFSQIAAYDSCPRQYYYAHILKIPTMGKHVFSYGKSMHSTLQKFFQLMKSRDEQKQGSSFEKEKVKKGKLSVSLEELLELFKNNWIDDWYEDKKQKKDYLKQGRETLREIYHNVEDEKPKVQFLEKGFNIKFNNYSFKGSIDRVDKVDGGVELVDYKTGNPKEKISFDQKKQLLIYQIAYERVFGEKVVNLKFHYLKDNSKIDFLGKEKDLIKVEDWLLENIQKINSCNFKEKSNENTCKYCDFKDICPFKI